MRSVTPQRRMSRAAARLGNVTPKLVLFLGLGSLGTPAAMQAVEQFQRRGGEEVTLTTTEGVTGNIDAERLRGLQIVAEEATGGVDQRWLSHHAWALAKQAKGVSGEDHALLGTGFLVKKALRGTRRLFRGPRPSIRRPPGFPKPQQLRGWRSWADALLDPTFGLSGHESGEVTTVDGQNVILSRGDDLVVLSYDDGKPVFARLSHSRSDEETGLEVYLRSDADTGQGFIVAERLGDEGWVVYERGGRALAQWEAETMRDWVWRDLPPGVEVVEDERERWFKPNYVRRDKDGKRVGTPTDKRPEGVWLHRDGVRMLPGYVTDPNMFPELAVLATAAGGGGAMVPPGATTASNGSGGAEGGASSGGDGPSDRERDAPALTEYRIVGPDGEPFQLLIPDRAPRVDRRIARMTRLLGEGRSLQEVIEGESAILRAESQVAIAEQAGLIPPVRIRPGDPDPHNNYIDEAQTLLQRVDGSNAVRGFQGLPDEIAEQLRASAALNEKHVELIWATSIALKGNGLNTMWNPEGRAFEVFEVLDTADPVVGAPMAWGRDRFGDIGFFVDRDAPPADTMPWDTVARSYKQGSSFPIASSLLAMRRRLPPETPTALDLELPSGRVADALLHLHFSATYRALINQDPSLADKHAPGETAETYADRMKVHNAEAQRLAQQGLDALQGVLEMPRSSGPQPIFVEFKVGVEGALGQPRHQVVTLSSGDQTLAQMRFDGTRRDGNELVDATTALVGDARHLLMAIRQSDGALPTAEESWSVLRALRKANNPFLGVHPSQAASRAGWNGELLVVDDLRPDMLPYPSSIRSPEPEVREFPTWKRVPEVDVDLEGTLLINRVAAGREKFVQLANLQGRPVAAISIFPWGDAPVTEERLLDEAKRLELVSASGLGPRFHGRYQDASGGHHLIVDIAAVAHVGVRPEAVTWGTFMDLETQSRRLAQYGLRDPDLVDHKLFLTAEGRLLLLDPSTFQIDGGAEPSADLVGLVHSRVALFRAAGPALQARYWDYLRENNEPAWHNLRLLVGYGGGAAP